MIVNNLFRHELDLTGVSPNNLVANEPHTMKARNRRIVVPLYGGFYCESLVVTDTVTGRALIDNQDYIVDDFLQVPMDLSGKEIATTIVVINKAVSATVSLTYQTIGGLYSVNADELKQQIETLKLDNRPVLWDNIIGKPDAYPPAPHMHDIGDAYGFEYIVHVLERIRQAILLGNSAELDLIWEHLNNLNFDEFKKHIADKNNPHDTTLQQLGGLTETEILDLIRKNAQDLTELLNHIKDKNNPHDTTADQVDAFNRKETRDLIEALRVAIVKLIDTHVSNKTNPHDVTPAQLKVPTIIEMNTSISAAKTAIEKLITDHENSTSAHPWSSITSKPTITAGNGLTGGGLLNNIGTTISMGTPLTVTATSTNSTSATSHAHAVSISSETVQGLVELATTAETLAGIDEVRAVTPAGVKAALDANKVVLPIASTTVAGIAKLATPALAAAGVDNSTIMTPQLVANMFIGMVSSFASAAVPGGWLTCNGAAVSRTTYSDLFAKIGTVYGVGDGTTTFNLPDLRGIFVRGQDLGKGVDSGRVLGSVQLDAMQRINGTFSGYTTNNTTNCTGPFKSNNATVSGPNNTDNEQEGKNTTRLDTATDPTLRTAEETRPTNIALVYAIKY